jgi:hypothetical protein
MSRGRRGRRIIPPMPSRVVRVRSEAGKHARCDHVRPPLRSGYRDLTSGKPERLTVQILGLLAAVAEGPIATGALVVIVLLLTQPWWCR